MKTIICLIVICLTVGLGFATTQADNRQKPQANSVQVECHLSYRSAPGKAFDSKQVKIKIPLQRGPVAEIDRSQKKIQTFDDMEVTLLYDVNTLRIGVRDLKSGKEIYARLYQLTPDLQNQFNGGHGFTGLGYINHPTSESQLQTFSEVIQPK